MSNLDIFKVGVGPSSSHTLGPLLAALKFVKSFQSKLSEISSLDVTLYGSLSLTGRGHLTDKAVIWGLAGQDPQNLNAKVQEEIFDNAVKNHILKLNNEHEISFNPILNVTFCDEFLPLHENALKFVAYDSEQNVLKEQIYYSVGGGFIKTKEELENPVEIKNDDNIFLIENSQKAIEICEKEHINLAELALKYELQFNSQDYIENYLKNIYTIMQEVYEASLTSKSMYLPGPLHLKRRAQDLKKSLKVSSDPLAIIDYISLYAIAISEENAAGSRVVTAPTNGACAVIPAVMIYLKNHTFGFDEKRAIDFLLTASLIGSFFKNNASISGAQAGCQAEIGSASSMAAGAMATVMGADAKIACSAAEIAMEHHLGLTCDPVYGLVQIPCIERNAFGAIKAIMAARMATSRDSPPKVALDDIIQTMYKTGKDMSFKYKETSLGGLALFVK